VFEAFLLGFVPNGSGSHSAVTVVQCRMCNVFARDNW